MEDQGTALIAIARGIVVETMDDSGEMMVKVEKDGEITTVVGLADLFRRLSLEHGDNVQVDVRRA